MSPELRVPFVAEGSVSWRSEERTALVCDLSERGLRVRVAEPPLGECTVRFPLPDGGPPVSARAAVRWSLAHPNESAAPLAVSCGVGFVDLDAAERERIGRVLDRFRQRPTPVLGIEQPRSGLTRVPYVSGCSLIEERGERPATVCNLSAFGAFVALASPPELGAAVRLRLDLPEPLGRFERPVTVTWRNPESRHRPHMLPEGCGVRFDALSRLDLRRLARLVNAQLARRPRGWN